MQFVVKTVCYLKANEIIHKLSCIRLKKIVSMFIENQIDFAVLPAWERKWMDPV